ncbi:MAG TPA: hypothetical protein VGM33_20820 [Baekduia sp.]|jgi:tetratricopeptide (TPR) repeat protein
MTIPHPPAARRTAPWLVALTLVLILPTAGGAQARAADQPAACAAADALLAQAELAKAADAYEDVLATDRSATCAARGLARISEARARETKACALAAKLSTAGQDDEAERHYAAALRQNVASACAQKGLGAPADDHGTWHDVGDVIDYAPKVPTALGAVLLILLVAIGAFLLLVALVRRRQPSLVVNDLADGAIDPKIGAAVTALMQRRLIGLRKRSKDQGDGYDLDLIVADVELLTKDEDLSDAVGALASVPQLQLLAAILAFVDRLVLKKGRLVADGDLLPAGGHGAGIAIGLRQRNGLSASDVIWADELDGWEAPAPAVPTPPPPAPAPGDPAAAGPPPDPDPYYRLSVPAAAWVQYQASCALNSSVEVLTTDPRSFALVSVGLRLHGEDKVLQAAELYVRALEVDPDNVPALVNLGMVVARVTGDFALASFLVARALSILEQFYEEPGR